MAIRPPLRILNLALKICAQGFAQGNASEFY